MAGHLMPFAAFLMESEPGATPLLEIVGDAAKELIRLPL
jgi:hypothetical protein